MLLGVARIQFSFPLIIVIGRRGTAPWWKNRVVSAV